MYDHITIYCFGFLGLFYHLCIMSREFPLLFVVKLAWWCELLLNCVCQVFGFSFESQ